MATFGGAFGVNAETGQTGVQTKRRLGQALLEQGFNDQQTSNSGLEAIGRIAKTLAGAKLRSDADRAQQEAEEKRLTTQADLARQLAGGEGEQASPLSGAMSNDQLAASLLPSLAESAVASSGPQAQLLTSEEKGAAGFRPEDVVERSPDGSYSVLREAPSHDPITLSQGQRLIDPQSHETLANNPKTYRPQRDRVRSVNGRLYNVDQRRYMTAAPQGGSSGGGPIVSLRNPQSGKTISIRRDDPRTDGLLSNGFVPFKASTQSDSPDGAVGATTSTTNNLQARVDGADQVVSLTNRLESSIQPGDTGAAGMLTRTGQNAIQQLGELSSLAAGVDSGDGAISGAAQSIQEGAQQARQMAAENGDDIDASSLFSSRLPAQEVLKNQLAYAIAKSQNGGRISNQDFEQAKAQVGSGGLMSNRRETVSRLRTIREGAQRDRDNALDRMNNGYRPQEGGGGDLGETSTSDLLKELTGG